MKRILNVNLRFLATMYLNVELRDVPIEFDFYFLLNFSFYRYAQ